MDINEWEILSDDGFIDADGFQNSVTVFDKNYFCTSPKSRKNTIHVPIQLDTIKVPDDDLVEEKDHVGVIKASDEESLSKVFFQIKENKLVDMKIDSPKSSGEAMEIMTSPRIKNIERENNVMMNFEKEEEDMNGGFNFWKWSLTGVGAICSFGVAAATICVLFFGTQHRNKLQQDQNIRFQIYTDDKRIKQVVQHATKLNEAFAAVRGVPLSRAHITYGGYYESL